MTAFTYTRTSIVTEATHTNTMSAVTVAEASASLGLSKPGSRIDTGRISQVADVDGRLAWLGVESETAQSQRCCKE